MDFWLCVKPHRGVSAPCGHLSSYFQPPEPLSQKSTPCGLSHPRHPVVCIYLFIFLIKVCKHYQVFFPPMSSCCALSSEACHSAESITDNAIPKSFFPAVHYLLWRTYRSTSGKCMQPLSWQGGAGINGSLLITDITSISLWYFKDQHICAFLRQFSSAPLYDSAVHNDVLRLLRCGRQRYSRWLRL